MINTKPMDGYQTNLQDKIIKFGKNNLLILALGFVGLILFVYGLTSLFFASKHTSQDILFEPKGSNSGNISVYPREENLVINIAVDIEGSVINPGVYHLPLGSRIQDAFVAAGGLSPSADREFIAKTINLATKLSDGAKIYVPKIGENINLTAVIGAEIGSPTGQININSSLEEELDSLPGIGPVTAQKIISGRPYASINDLLEKKIVGGKVFDQIKEKIRVY